MQFLVYLTILMVSVSTVLLEVHWLTTPPPQPKAAVQASAPPPRPKVEGPNAELSPIYPKKLEPVQPTSAAANTTAAKVETGQKPPAETTGVATRGDDSIRSASAPPPDNAQNAQAYAAPPKRNATDEATASKETSRSAGPGAGARIQVKWIEERGGGSMMRMTTTRTTQSCSAGAAAGRRAF